MAAAGALLWRVFLFLRVGDSGGRLACILTDYFNNYDFSKAQIISSLMMVIKPKHVGAVLM